MGVGGGGGRPFWMTGGLGEGAGRKLSGFPSKSRRHHVPALMEIMVSLF